MMMGWFWGSLALMGAITFHASQTNWPIETAPIAGLAGGVAIAIAMVYPTSDY